MMKESDGKGTFWMETLMAGAYCMTRTIRLYMKGSGCISTMMVTEGRTIPTSIGWSMKEDGGMGIGGERGLCMTEMAK